MAADDNAVNVIGRATKVSEEVAAAAADDVDRGARFPSEAMGALRAERLLSVMVPPALGGEGVSIGAVAEAVTVLARNCASTAMIFAMHQIQVACLVRHGNTPAIEGLLRNVVDAQTLLASATTETGVGGDVRTSICAVERAGGRFRLEKDAPVISYGASADGVLATARRSADSPPSDQVLVACLPPGLVLEQRGGWDTMGFRGTCSTGFKLVAEGPDDLILPDSYGDVSSQTMLPVSHIVWSSVWLGIAAAAVDRAGKYVRGEARKRPGVTSPAAVHLAELTARYQQFHDLVRTETARFEALADDREALSSLGFALAMNSLKISTSSLVVDVVSRALLICGMAGYREDSPFSMGRLLRDAYGAALMVNNDRILANNAQILLVHRET
jgi:acyl-CoA dehydrogenase